MWAALWTYAAAEALARPVWFLHRWVQPKRRQPYVFRPGWWFPQYDTPAHIGVGHERAPELGAADTLVQSARCICRMLKVFSSRRGSPMRCRHECARRNLSGGEQEHEVCVFVCLGGGGEMGEGSALFTAAGGWEMVAAYRTPRRKSSPSMFRPQTLLI